VVKRAPLQLYRMKPKFSLPNALNVAKSFAMSAGSRSTGRFVPGVLPVNAVNIHFVF